MGEETGVAVPRLHDYSISAIFSAKLAVVGAGAKSKNSNANFTSHVFFSIR